MNRRSFLQLALGAPFAANDRVTRVSVDSAGVIGALNSWRDPSAPASWNELQADEAFKWAVEMSKTGVRHAFSVRESRFLLQAPEPGMKLYVGECVGAGQQNWAEFFLACTNSPGHLRILQHRPFVHAGLAGCEVPGTKYRWYWVYRAVGWGY